MHAISTLTEADAEQLSEQSWAAHGIVHDTHTVWKGDDCIEIDPTEWLRAVLCITTLTKGGTEGIKATNIYDVSGSSLRKAGITNVDTDHLTIRPGRYNPRTEKTPPTRYTPSIPAIATTAAWLRTENRKAQTRQGTARQGMAGQGTAGQDTTDRGWTGHSQPEQGQCPSGPGAICYGLTGTHDPTEGRLEEDAGSSETGSGGVHSGRLDDNTGVHLGRLDTESVSDGTEAGSEGGVHLGRLDNSDDGNGGVHSGRLDESSGGSGGVHSGRLDSKAYLKTDLRVTASQRQMIDEAVAHSPDEFASPRRGMIVHLIQTAEIYSTDWAPIGHQTLTDQLPGGWILEERAGGTRQAWDYEGSPVEAKGGGWYSKKHNKARHFRIDSEWYRQFVEAGQTRTRSGNRQKAVYDAVTGTRKRTERTLTTTLRDDSGHKYGVQRGDLPHGHYSLVDGALRILDDAEHRIDLRRLQGAKAGYLRALEDAERRHEAEGTAKTEAALQTAKSRYTALLSGVSFIERQTKEKGGQVALLQNAYEVQEVSGRLTFKRGGPQGLPGIVKALAYDLTNVQNYDIKSSQTIGLRQLATELQELGDDVDTAALDGYIAAGGKDWVVREYGLPRALVKRVEHAVKFGAGLPASMEQAHVTQTEIGHLPEVAQHVEEHYASRKRQNAALQDLGEVFGEIRAMIQALADGLLTTYWDAHKRPGGRGKGWQMYNACGLGFRPQDYEEGHEQRSKAMAWYLQGLEAAYVHAITILSEAYDYEVMANEHDGCITTGEIPDEAKRRARELSGFRQAELVEKPFADAEDVCVFCTEHSMEPPFTLEETQCESKQTTQVAATSSDDGSAEAKTNTTNRPGTSGSLASATTAPRSGASDPMRSSSPRGRQEITSARSTRSASSPFSSPEDTRPPETPSETTTCATNSGGE